MMTFYLELPHLAINDTKMQIPDKKYRTYTVCPFWGTWSVSALRYLGLDHFGRIPHESLWNTSETMEKKF